MYYYSTDWMNHLDEIIVSQLVGHSLPCNKIGQTLTVGRWRYTEGAVVRWEDGAAVGVGFPSHARISL